MSKDLPVKKIYIDSKFRRGDSVSSSNFKIDLPQTLKPVSYTHLTLPTN